jgi:hypothetical protein
VVSDGELSDTCQTEVTIVDTIPPTLTCPLDTTLYLNTNCEVTYDGPPDTLASDSCGVDTLYSIPTLPFTYTSPEVDNILWIAEDASENADSCEQIITVLDTISPVITCPPDDTLEADQNCQATYSGPPASATDNCKVDTIISDPLLPATFTGLGDHTITWTARDSSGNEDICVQTITLIDIFPPPCCDSSSVGGDSVWTVEVVDSQSQGPYNAIALWYDSEDTPYPHISYRMDEGGGKGLWTAWKDPNPSCRLNPGWSLLPLDTMQAGRGAWTSITIQQLTDPVGAWIHVSYTDTVSGDRMIFYSLRSQCDVRVDLDTTDNRQDLGTFGTDIAVAPYDSVICTVYYDATNGDLKYAEKVYPSGSWTTVTTDSIGDVGKYPAIAIGSNGVRHVSYYDSTNGNLKYASCSNNCTSSSNWTYQTVPDPDTSTDNLGKWTEIAVDNATTPLPHISYINVTKQSVKHAVQTTTIPIPAWEIHVVQDATLNLVASTSIGVGAGDTLHVSYSDRTNQYLMYATSPPTDWDTWTHTRIPDPWGNVGLWNSIAVGSGNISHISYSASDTTCNWKALKYAVKQ